MYPNVPPCTLPDGYWQVAAGKIVNATFWLHLLARPATIASTLVLRPVSSEDRAAIQDAFVRIGADSLWDRAAQLALDPAALRMGPADRLYFAFDARQQHVGLLDLRFHEGAGTLDVEITYIGVFREHAGRGLGRQLLNAALDLVWRERPRSVFPHTCNTDHPRALPLYLSCGFVPFRAGFQIMDDPRLQGLLPCTSAAHVPLVESNARS